MQNIVAYIKLPEYVFLSMKLYDTRAVYSFIVFLCFLQLLQSFKIMDYSLLMGIHNMDQASRERERSGGNSGDSGGSEGAVTPDQRRPQAQRSLYCTAMESIQGEARGKGALESEDQ